MPDELPEGQHLLNGAIRAIMVLFSGGGEADNDACAALMEDLAVYSSGRIVDKRQEIKALMGAAFYRLVRAEDVMSGRYDEVDPTDALRRFADWIDENRDAQA